MMRRHKNRRIIWGFVLSLFIMLLQGCWSSREIEDLGVIAGIAMDLEKDGNIKEKLKKKDRMLPNRPLFTLTNQFINTQGAEVGTNQGAAASIKTYINISETGDVILPTLRDMTLKIEKRAFAEHAKVIVISADLARMINLQQTLDFFIREQEIRPSCLVVISKGRASQTLETKKTSIIPAFHIYQITKGEKRNAKILPSMPLGKLEGKMYSGSSFLLQNINLENGEVIFAGGAVISGKTKKLRGFLNEKELEGLAWLTGNVQGGVVRGIDQKSGQPIIFEGESTKSVIKPHVRGNQISFDVQIKSEGRIAENWVLSGEAFHDEFLKRAKISTQNKVEQLVKNVLNKTQKQYRADVAGFGNKLRIEYPHEWKKVKKNWDEIYSNIPITYHVNITIKDYGMTGS